jgi:hypothetical protein
MFVYLRLKEFTRIDECDSCNEVDYGHTNFKVKANEFNISVRHNLDQVKPYQLPSKQTAPSQSGVEYLTISHRSRGD